ncbi:MAG: hypothetical protein MR965_12050 [Lachnospiraceae bacterium]|nr:hypothetical protein [Lachnospiraceae bacterium]
MDTKKKMSNRDKMMLFIFGAIIIVAAAYFLVFAKMTEKKNELETQNSTLTQEVSKLETMEAQRDEVLEDTRQTQIKVADVLGKFPAEVRTEDAIYDLNEMYESISDVKILSENFNMNQLFYQQGAVSDGTADSQTTTDSSSTETEKTNPASVSAITSDTPATDVISAAADYTGYRSTVNVTFSATYNALKEVVDFIKKSPDRMTISDISATAGEDDDLLTCSMTVDMYAISGTGEIYESPNVSNGNTGVNNIFRK